MAEPETPNLTALTVDLLSAYVSNNIVASEDLAGLVHSTYAALARIDAPADTAPPTPEYVPAVSIRKSLGSRDVIISLINGKPYKTLKRHLSSHGLSIAEYRARYNLPANYPMVAPAYSEHRRNVAHKLGLGQRMKTSEAAPTAPETVEPPKKAEARKPAAVKPILKKAAEANRAAAPKPAIAKPAKSNGATPPKGAAAQAAAPKPGIKKRGPATKTTSVETSPPAEAKPVAQDAVKVAKARATKPSPVTKADVAKSASADAAKPQARKKKLSIAL